MRACAASWWCARVTRPEHVGFGSVLSATLWERRRTSSAELERSAAIPLAGMQLDSSPLVLVAEVSSGLLALRPRPIVRDVGLSLLRAPGEGAIRQSTVRHGQARSVRGARRHYDCKGEIGQAHTWYVDRYFSSKHAVAGRG